MSKKSGKRICKALAVLLALSMIFSMTTAVYADDTVPGYEFETGSEYAADTEDLFAADEPAEDSVLPDVSDPAEEPAAEEVLPADDLDDAQDPEEPAEEAVIPAEEPEIDPENADLQIEEADAEEPAEEETLLFDPEDEDLFGIEKAAAGVAKGTEVTGTFNAIEGVDIATIRYCWTENDEQRYGFAQFAPSVDGSKYEYSFSAPCDNFDAVQASETTHGGENISGATVIAAYYDLNTWDGAVDVSWYDPEASEYHLSTPAQFAGLAAIVNGSIDSDIKSYNVKGYRSYSEFEIIDAPSALGESDEKMALSGKDRGLPDCIECEYFKETDLGGPVSGPCYVGVEKNDFLNKTVYLEADLYMGGGSGAVLDKEKIYEAKANLHDGTHEGYVFYPNWAPVGGMFLADVDDLNTAVKASFDGVLEGNGHFVYDLYCYRWSYPKPGTTAYGYADSTGIIGRLGYFYSEDEGNRVTLAPAIRSLGLTGFVYGRRSVGGILGRAGSGTYYNGPIYLENLANYATVYATDSKGVAGIVGTFWNKDVMDGQVLKYRRGGAIINCYNRGNVRQMEYSGPAGGIVGENDSADIFCCYNTGEISSVSKMGRGIGANDAGSNYTVDNCYYLKNHYDCDVSQYYGYYYQNAASDVLVRTELMTESQMTDGTLLEALNVCGTAYYEGAGGYPVLAWEAGVPDGTLFYADPEGGTVSGSLPEGTYPAGTIVYLTAAADEEWQWRYFTLNDAKISSRFVTVSQETRVSAFFQKAGRGFIEIPNNPICEIRVFRVTGTEETGYEYTELKNGDEIREGNELAFETVIREGQIPQDPNLEYRATAGVEQPFLYTITYLGAASENTYLKSIVVKEAINEGEMVLRVEVEPLTIEKLWKNFCDTDWYEEGMTSYTITTAEELAGIDKLVESETTDFYGVTLTLGNDISMVNSDGSSGVRSWDGIGNSSASFKGTFDGAGYRITDLSGVQYGLFAHVEGKSAQDRAVVKNVSVYGKMTGYNASGIAGKITYAQIDHCSNFCVIDGTEGSGSSYSGGIAGQETIGCSVSDCINYAPVSGVYRTGGIVGESTGTSTNAGKMTDCINYGDISVPGERPSLTYAGGVAGAYKGALVRCANYGNIVSAANYSGGLVGYMTQSGSSITAKMTDCCNTGTVRTAVTQETGGAGGLIGNAARFVLKNCFNYGAVTRAEGCVALIGSFAGRYTTNDNNKTTAVYLLDSACEIVLSGVIKDPETGESSLRSMTYEEVAALDKSDVAGIFNADAAAFAAEDGVLASINGDGAFVLQNGQYPELTPPGTLHLHSGGTATCSEQAVCEDCGLHYGATDPENHIGTELRNIVIAEWMQDGYSGDVCCVGCGAVLETGHIVPVDTTVKAITVSVTENGEVIRTKEYTVAEFDALKSTEVVGYQYGNTSVTTTCMASDRYVTLEALLTDMGWTMDDLVTASVLTTSSFEDCSRETLLTRNLYVEENGNTKIVPAAIGIYYSRQNGYAEEVIKESKLGSLTFMTGLSQSDIDNGSVGGFRLIMPVTSVSFEIARGRKNLENAVVTGIKDKNYTGKALTQEPVVTLAGEVLENGKDYMVHYSGNIAIGTATVTIIGTGDYTGTVTETFKVKKAASTIKVTASASSAAVGKTVDLTVKATGKVSFASSNEKIATVSAKGVVTAKKVGTVKITAVSAGDADHEGATGTVTIKVVPAATDSVKAEVQAKGFKVSWKKVTGATGYYVYRNGKKIGTVSGGSKVTYTDKKATGNLTKYTYKIVAFAATGTSTLSRSATTYFITQPAISKVQSKAAKKATVQWKKNAKAAGYQIRYSKKSSFSGAKALKVTNAKTVSKVITGLTSGKTWYVQVRTYKKVGKTTYYSAWSAKKSVKVK